jgi:hypothetical protein
MTWRFHLQSLPDRTWIDRDLPLQNGQVIQAISGPGAISGYLAFNYPNLDAIKEWGALLVAEQDGADPVAAIVDTVTTENGRLRVEAGGFSMYPTGMPWIDADYAGIQVDPLDIFRMVWTSLQSKPSGDLGVVVDPDTSSVRLGIPEDPKLTAAKDGLAAAVAAEASAKADYNAAAASKNATRVNLLAAGGLPGAGLVIWQDTAPAGSHRSTKNLWIDKNDANKAYVWTGKDWVLQTVSTQATINTLLAAYNNATTAPQQAAWTAKKTELAAAKKKKSDINGGEAQPFTLTWWENHDLGSVLADLANTTPFDYREASAWSGEDITHRLELGVPALGARRPDLRFEVGVNATAAPPLLERDYASEVMVLGSGTGRAMVRATATGNPGRVRRATVVQRKDIGKPDKAATAARAEVQARSADWVFTTLDVSDHPMAPYGSYRPGDVVYVTGDTGWRVLDDWVRVTQIISDCVTGAINLKVEAQ